MTPFKIGDFCETVNFQWVYKKCADEKYRIEINDGFGYNKQNFLLLDYPVLFSIKNLDIDLNEQQDISCFGIKILIGNQIRYLFFGNSNLPEHITLVI